ncbi:MAG: hypothetical protein ACK5NK_00735 [Niabella sp.]
MSVTPKYFYNFNKREQKGKTTFNNSGNYIGARVKLSSANNNYYTNRINTVLVNAHWGMQRAMKKHWLYNMHFGVGVANNTTQKITVVYPAMEFKFSYILWKNKNRE